MEYNIAKMNSTLTNYKHKALLFPLWSQLVWLTQRGYLKLKENLKNYEFKILQKYYKFGSKMVIICNCYHFIIAISVDTDESGDGAEAVQCVRLPAPGSADDVGATHPRSGAILPAATEKQRLASNNNCCSRCFQQQLLQPLDGN